MNKTWLELKNIDVFINERKIINSINLELKLGEHTVVLGPNGSGKSTLINVITRNIHPIFKDNSSLKLFGLSSINIFNLRKNIGYVSKDIDDRIHFKEKVSEVIISGLIGSIGLRGMYKPSKNEINEAYRIMTELDLLEVSREKYVNLSDGQKRRVLIGRAIINNPRILIFDEPTASLDIKSSYDFINLIRKISTSEVTILCITNTLDNIIPETQNVILLKNGLILNQGSPKDVLTSKNLSDLYDTDINVFKSDGFWRSTPVS